MRRFLFCNLRSEPSYGSGIHSDFGLVEALRLWLGAGQVTWRTVNRFLDEKPRMLLKEKRKMRI